MGDKLKDFDIMRLAGLKPKPLKLEDKIYPSFNRRIMAATVDLLIISLFIAPLVDYLFRLQYGLPPANIAALSADASRQPMPGEIAKQFFEQMHESGYWDYWVANVRWQLYVVCVYLTVCWHYWSATPGKILFRMQIVDAKTHRIMGSWQSIFRIFAYFISGAVFALGFLWMSIDKRRRGWHDLIARTEVVDSTWLKNTTSEAEAVHPSDSPAPSPAE